MSGWIKKPRGKTWHQVRKYSSYYVMYSLCGVRWHPKDKRFYRTDGWMEIWRGNKCSKCEIQAIVLELA